MKRILKCLSVILAAVFSIMPFLTACNNGGDTTTYYTMSFYSDGALYNEMELKEGETISAPAYPVKEGHDFLGWFTDEAGTEEYTFPSQMPASDVSLYAKFQQILKVIMSFNTMGGVEVNRIENYIGSTITLPTPIYAGYVFEGWYKDAEYKEAFTSTVMPDQDTTLYAKWRQDDSYAVVQIIVDGEVTKTEAVKKGEKMSRPSFKLDGYALSYWANEQGEEVSFPYTVNNNCALTAVYYSNGLTVVDGCITEYNGKSTVVIIPEKMRGVTVTEIGTEDGFGVFDIDRQIARTITEIRLPETIKKIHDRAFANLDALTRVNIPSGVEYLGENLFENCSSLVDIDFDGNDLYPFEDGALLNQERTKLLIFLGTAESYTIPASVTEIGESAFSYVSIGKLIIPQTVTKIADTAFKYTLIKEIEFGASVTKIAAEAFKNASLLETVNITANVTEIDTSAFENCKNLKNVTLPDSLLMIRMMAFYGCEALTFIDLKNAKIEAGNVFSLTGLTEFEISSDAEEVAEDMFVNWNHLEKITIPASVKKIGKNAFSGCAALKEVVFEENSQLMEIGNSAFKDCGFESFDFASLTKLSLIQDSAFANCTKLEEIDMPAGLDKIGLGAFSGCSSLTTLKVPFVGGYSMDGFNAYLKSIENPNDLAKQLMAYMDEGNGEKFVEFITDECPSYEFLFGYIFGLQDYAGATLLRQYQNADGESVTYYIPASLKSITIDGPYISAYAFNYMSFESGIQMTDNVKIIGSHAFAYMMELDTLELKEGLVTIKDYAFSMTAFESAVLPSSLQILGPYAYYYCQELTHVRFLGTDYSVEVASSVFDSCEKLTTVVQGDATDKTGVYMTNARLYPYVFYKCESLITADIASDNISLICSYEPTVVYNKSSYNLYSGLFAGCTSLTELKLSENLYCLYSVVNTQTGAVTTHKESAFPGSLVSNCTALKKINATAERDVNIPSNVVKIHANAFVSSGIEEIYTGENTTTMGAIVFANSALKYADMAHVVNYEMQVFRQATNLETVILANELTKMGYAMFWDATSLKTVGYHAADGSIVAKEGLAQFSENLTDMSMNDIFQNCAFSEVILPENIPVMGSHLLYGCKNLTKVVVPASVVIIGTQCFEGSGLQEIDLTNAKSLIEVGDYCFNACTGLKEVTLPEGVTYLGTQAFRGCTSLESVWLPSTLVTFSRLEGFRDCKSLKNITMLAPLPSECEGGSSLEARMFYSTELERNLTVEELKAQGVTFYVAREALELYKEHLATYYSTDTYVFVRDGFGWMTYYELMKPIDVGMYTDGTNTLTLSNNAGTTILSGKVGSTTLENAEASGTEGTYTANGVTATVDGQVLTVSASGSNYTLYRISGAYVDTNTPDRLHQFNTNLTLRLDGSVILTHYRPCKSNSTPLPHYAKDYGGKFVIEEDGNVYIEVSISDVQILKLKLLKGENGYKMATLQEDGTYKESSSVIVYFPDGTSTLKETLNLVLR